MEISLALWTSTITSEFNNVLADLSEAVFENETAFREALVSQSKSSFTETLDKDIEDCSRFRKRFKEIEDRFITMFFDSLFPCERIRFENGPNFDLIDFLDECSKITPPEETYAPSLKEHIGLPRCSHGFLAKLVTGKFGELSEIDTHLLQEYYEGNYFPIHIIVRDLAWIFANNYIAFAKHKIQKSTPNTPVEGLCTALHMLRPSAFITELYGILLSLRTIFLARLKAPQVTYDIDRIGVQQPSGTRYLTLKKLDKRICEISIPISCKPTFETSLVRLGKQSLKSRRLLRAASFRKSNEMSQQWNDEAFYKEFLGQIEAFTMDDKSTILNRVIDFISSQKWEEKIDLKDIVIQYYKTLFDSCAQKSSVSQTETSYIELTKQIFTKVSQHSNTENKINVYHTLLECLIWKTTDDSVKEKFSKFLDALAIYDEEIAKHQTCLMFPSTAQTTNTRSLNLMRGPSL